MYMPRGAGAGHPWTRALFLLSQWVEIDGLLQVATSMYQGSCSTNCGSRRNRIRPDNRQVARSRVGPDDQPVARSHVGLTRISTLCSIKIGEALHELCSLSKDN